MPWNSKASKIRAKSSRPDNKDQTLVYFGFNRLSSAIARSRKSIRMCVSSLRRSTLPKIWFFANQICHSRSFAFFSAELISCLPFEREAGFWLRDWPLSWAMQFYALINYIETMQFMCPSHLFVYLKQKVIACCAELLDRNEKAQALWFKGLAP